MTDPLGKIAEEEEEEGGSGARLDADKALSDADNEMGGAVGKAVEVGWACGAE